VLRGSNIPLRPAVLALAGIEALVWVLALLNGRFAGVSEEAKAIISTSRSGERLVCAGAPESVLLTL
jgi:hypothetical protein